MSGRHPRRVPFLAATLGAPAIVTGLSAILSTHGHAVFAIAFVAGMLGWPAYLIVGVPVMYLMVRRAGPGGGVFLVGGLAAIMGAPAVMTVQFVIDGAPFTPETVKLALWTCWSFGLIFAAIWSLASGLLYRMLDRAFPQ